MVSAIAYGPLLAAFAGFAATVLVYLFLSDIYGSKSLPAWMGGEVVPMLFCVFLTGSIVGTGIGLFSAATTLPSAMLWDMISATGLLVAAFAAPWLLHKLALGLFRHRHAA